MQKDNYDIINELCKQLKQKIEIIDKLEIRINTLINEKNELILKYEHILKIYDKNENKITKKHNKYNEYLIDNYKNTKEINDNYYYTKENIKIVDIKKNKKILLNDNQLLKTFPIYIFPKSNNKCYKYAAGELCNTILYNYNLKKMVNEDKKTSLEEIYNYILESKKNHENKSNINKYEIEKKIERCNYLYNKYGDNLKLVSFSTGRIFRLGKDNWDKWLKELDNIIINNLKH